ncbi:MAG: sialate O-acetylesterase, partial [Planctomycetota bacterium]
TVVSAGSVFGDVRLPAVISDNMVIQQGMKAPIWGWAEPGEKVTVKTSWPETITSSFERSYRCTTDKNGKWMVKIHPPQEAGGPYKMTISGNSTITVKNILVGEVWICSGQSNMEWRVERSANPEQEIASADYPNIRLFKVEKTFSDAPQEDCKGSWASCQPETVRGFSAVAYYFGRSLHRKLDVPVGLIRTCWGGTPAEAWTRYEVLAGDADFKPIVGRFEQAWSDHLQKMDNYSGELASWLSAAKQAQKGCGATPVEPEKPGSPRRQGAPSQLYNAMISPLIPYGIRGAIWYQGESNVKRAYQYRRLFPAMIDNWRKDWGQGDFPFYYVQIAPFKYGQQYAGVELREAQLMALALPHTGMVVTSDVGNIEDIHPKNKQDVGKRLALWALAKTYGRKGVVCSGPVYRSMKVEGNKVRLFFDYVGGGLATKGGELGDFAIAGADRSYVDAKAEICGGTIVVSADEVKKPVAVRYGWSNTAAPSLFNKEGLPASSFRTDDWPGVTVDAR